MLRPGPRTLVLLLTGWIAQSLASAPASEWPTALPEDVGLDSGPLGDMLVYMREHKIPVHSIQIVRHGRLVFDAYIYPFNAEMRHDVASVTKSITSTLVGIALQDGSLTDVKQPLLSFFPGRAIANLDERKRRITLEDLLTMRAGWDCGFEPNEARLFEMRRSTNWLQFMLDLPMMSDPGIRFAYCSGNPHVLSLLISHVTHSNALAFARQKLFEPLGITDVYWPADPEGHTHGWGDLQLRPKDMAKIGQLFLQRGRWGDREIVSESWIAAATRPHVEKTVNKDHYGYGWWVKGNDYPGMFEAVGRGGQRINVWAAKDLVLVFTGGEFEPGDLAKFILQSIRSDDSLAANPQSVAKLKRRLIEVTQPPPAEKPLKLPSAAARVSGRAITLSTNSLGLRELTLRFAEPSEATVDLLVASHRHLLRIGLDGVPRFSPNSLVKLPSATTGRWIGENTFLLQINLVGGINYYEIKLSFPEQDNNVAVELKERTGLNNERFNGVLPK